MNNWKLLTFLFVISAHLIGASEAAGYSSFFKSAKENGNEEFCTAGFPTRKKPSCSFDIDHIVSGRFHDGTSARDNYNIVPKWLNVTLAREGQKFAQKNLFAIGMANMYGLLAVLTIPDSYEALIFTHNSDTRDKSLRRYIATAVQINLWYDEAIKEDYDKANLDAWAQSLFNVRRVHKDAADKATKHGFPLNQKGEYDNAQLDHKYWEAVQQDLDAGLPKSQKNYPQPYLDTDKKSSMIKPMNQFIFAMTQFSLAAYPVIRSKETYLWDEDDEGLKGYVHLWAILGYALGMDDEYNICLQKNMQEIKEYFEEIQDKFYAPSIYKMNNEVKVLLEAIFKVMHDQLPFSGWTTKSNVGRVFFTHFIRDVLKIPVPNQEKQFSIGDKLFQVMWNKFAIPASKGFLASVKAGTALKNMLLQYVKKEYGLDRPGPIDLANKVLYYPPKYSK